MGLKAKLGVVCVVVGVGVAIALPGISGVVAGNTLENELSPLAESLGYSVQNVSFDRGFSSTQVHVLLAGEGLKSLNNESLELTGVLTHGGVSDFPIMVSGDFEVAHTQGFEDDQLKVSGTAYPQISWSGAETIQFEMNPVVIPVDPENGSVLAVQGYSGHFDSTGSKSGEFNVELSEISLQVTEGGYEVAAIEVSPSKITFTPDNRTWALSTPGASVSITELENKVTIKGLEFGGNEINVDGLISSRGFVKTGEVTASLDEKVLLKSMDVVGTVENVSVAALGDLAKLINTDEEVDSKSVETAILSILDSQPRYALNHFRIDTGNGTFEMSFDMAATENTVAAVKSLMANPPQNEVQEYLAAQNLVNNIRSKARIQVSEDLIGWGCELISAQDVADPIQAQAVAAACKGLVEGGHFLNMACTQGSWDCVQKMEQVRVAWEKERALELSLDEGRVLLNKIEFEAEGLL